MFSVVAGEGRTGATSLLLIQSLGLKLDHLHVMQIILQLIMSLKQETIAAYLTNGKRVIQNFFVTKVWLSWLKYPSCIQFNLISDYLPTVKWVTVKLFLYNFIRRKKQMLTNHHRREPHLCVSIVAAYCNLYPGACWSTSQWFMGNAV